MNTDFIKGIIVPILTPVDKNEVIDEGKMRKQVDFVIDGGVSGILAFGSNGEFYMTEEDEMMKALKIMLNHASGRVPVYMGIGAISTKKCIRIAKAAAAAISVHVLFLPFMAYHSFPVIFPVILPAILPAILSVI